MNMMKAARALVTQPRRWGGLLALLAVVVFCVTGLAQLREDTTMSSFLPANDPALMQMQSAAQAFGGDPVVVLAESAQPKTLLDNDQLPRLLSLEGRLARLPDVAVVHGPGTVLNQIAGAARGLIAGISGTRDRIKAEAQAAAVARGESPAQVQQAVQDSTTQYDMRYGALLAQGLPAGLPTLRNPDFVNAVVFDASGNPRAQWRYIIPTPNAVAILVRPRENLDQAGTERLVTAVREAANKTGLVTSRLTISGSPTIAAQLGSTVQREIPLVGAAAVLLIACCYLLIPWARPRARRLLPLLAALTATALTLALFGWLGRPLSLGVVAFLPIMIGIGSDFPAYLIHRESPLLRIAVVATASAFGFASLALSPLPFVRDLGLALGVGVLLALGVALGLRALVPPLESGGGAAQQGGTAGAGDDGRTGSADDERPRPAAPAKQRAGRMVLLAVCAAVAAGGWMVLPHLSIEASPDRLAEGLPAVTDARHVEQLLGSSGEVELVLTGRDVATPAALDWMRRVESDIELAHGDQLRPIVSLPDLLQFLGPSPSAEQLSSALDLLPRYLTAAVLNDAHTRSVISLGVSFQDLAQQRVLLDSVRRSLPPTPLGTSLQIVGLPVAAARGLELVSRDRYLTNFAGILAAGLVLLLGLRRIRLAGHAVLAAALATGWGLGLTWILDIPLSPLSVALGSLTTATACEFTVLLGLSRPPRAPQLRRTVGIAALAASLGYLALTASRLAIIRDFGLLLSVTVLLSLLAAYLVTTLLPSAGIATSSASVARGAHDAARVPRGAGVG
jgi:hypothetical protein